MGFPEYAREVSRRWASHQAALVVLQRTPSTHLLGRRIAREYSDERVEAPVADFLAWRQTEGRGREGRRWSSPAGAGVYATLVRPLAPPARRTVALETLPLLVAASLCEALNVHLEGRCRLKWPNDLLVGGRKLGGVLIDAASRGENGGAVVISFGVNFGAEPADTGATSVELLAPGRTTLAALSAELVEAVDGGLARREAASAVVERYRGLSLHRPGEAMRCRAEGREVEGVFQGFDRHGFLRLLVSGEERLLRAGEVSGGA